MENRISAYFSIDSQAAPATPTSQSVTALDDARAAGHLVRGVDLYQAARARALFDCQLNKLFNPEMDAQ